VLHANSNSIKKNKTIKAPSQSTRKGKPKQHSIPIPNSQGPRHCRICHCTTRRLDALHRHPSSLNHSPHYPNLRTPLHLAPKARVLNHYPPASLPAHSTAQHNSVHKKRTNAVIPRRLCTHVRMLYHIPTPSRTRRTHSHPPQHSTSPAHHLPTAQDARAPPGHAISHARPRRAESPAPHPQTRTRAKRPNCPKSLDGPSASRRGIRAAVTHAR
jgi:hypothetical protein